MTELYTNDELTPIKPSDFYATRKSYALNSQRKQENAKERIFNTSDDNVIDYDTNMYYASTSSISCSLHEANNDYDKSFKHSFLKSKVMATKSCREFFTPIDKEFQHSNRNKCTSKRTRYNEKIAYLERERSMNIRDTDNDEKCIYDSNKRLSLLPSHFRRESGASNSSIRFLISNNNSPVLRQHINPSKNSIDNDLIEECFIENSSPNVENK